MAKIVTLHLNDLGQRLADTEWLSFVMEEIMSQIDPASSLFDGYSIEEK